jgi:NADPH:quinone reductase
VPGGSSASIDVRWPEARLLPPTHLSIRDVAAVVKAQTDGRGADMVFDVVGGVMFETALSCLARKGRLIEFDLLDFVHNESRLCGADSRKTRSDRICRHP